MSNHMRFLKVQLYSLKREYGFSLSIYRQTVGNTNLDTGAKTLTRVSYDIQRAVVVPIKFDTSAFYSASFLKFAREFAYGGFQDIDAKRIIIDSADLPIGFKIIPEDFIVYQHKKYEIKYSEPLENNIGYQMVVQHLTGSPTNEIINLAVRHDLRFLGQQEGQL